MTSFPPVAAVSTAPGPAGIAVIRLSGVGVYAIADALCPSSAVPPSSLSAGSFRRYVLRDASGARLDEAIVLSFRAPHSYTGEDTVEFQVHGGGKAAERVLRALFEAGAAPAEPGEFTRRAFLNGRLSLDQAEAVMDLIRARSDRAARAATEQLAGALRTATDTLYDEIVALCADLEATLDFSDEDVSGFVRAPRVVERANHLLADLVALDATFREGHLLREGALVVLAGPVNAGKSTLFNALLGTQRAIVNAAPGTTRDSIEETLLVRGIPLRLADTAGLRTTEDEIEEEGIARARALVARADLVLLLAETGTPFEPLSTEGPVLRVHTKADAHPDVGPEPGVLSVSARTGEGLNALKEAVCETLGVSEKGGDEGTGVAVSERHHKALLDAAHAIREAVRLYREGAEEAAVPVASFLRTAAERIGEITGRVYTEDLLTTIFGRFCVGK